MTTLVGQKVRLPHDCRCGVGTAVIPRHEAIMGLDIRTAFPCRCGCTLLRVCPHSKVSDMLILKCAWCGKRRGKPTHPEIEALVEFVDRYGWNQQSLRYDENSGRFHV